MHVRPFTERDLDAAADLLAARQRALGPRTPLLAPRYGEPVAVRPALTAAWQEPGVSGVVAERDGLVAGYLIGAVTVPAPMSTLAGYVRPRPVTVLYAGHATVADPDGEIVRTMYAALAPAWLRGGCFSHYLQLPAADGEASAAWFSLGFGQESLHAARGTDPADLPSVAGFTVRRAGPADADMMVQLIDALERHHAATPLFRPYNAVRAVERRAEHVHGLADPTQRYWLAERNGVPVALQQYVVPGVGPEIPERCIHLTEAYTAPSARGSGAGTALLRHGLAQARADGFSTCLVDWVTPNLSAHAYWLARGFRPLSAWLARHVDTRIAWAGTERG